MLKLISLIVVAFALILAQPLDSYSKESHNQSQTVQKHKKPKVQKQSVKKSASKKKQKHVASSHKKYRSEVRKSKKSRSYKRLREYTRSKRIQLIAENSSDQSEKWVEHAKQGQLKSTGKASWYGKDFHGGPTASGVKYDMYTFTAAHRTLPMGTVVKVTRKDNDKSVMVCVTDRGPYVRGRIIDLSYAAATQLDLRNKGVGDVRLEVVSDAKGKPLKSSQAFYVQYTAARSKKMAGPYKEFADAAAMQEALQQAHPEAKVVLGEARRK